MLIQYWRPNLEFPALEVRGPKVSPEDKSAAALRPPQAAPQHCKPWLAAQSLQIVVPYPYKVSLAVTGKNGDHPEGQFLDSNGQALRTVALTSLSPSYFTVNTQYQVVTPAGFGIYVTATPEAPAAAIPGLIESWWYPKTLFAVFPTPTGDERIVFRYGDPLCLLLPVPCEELRVAEIDPDGYAALCQREQEYDDYRNNHTDLQWMSAAHRTFSHAYRVFGRTQSPPDDAPPKEVK